MYHRTSAFIRVSSLYAHWSQITRQCVRLPVILRHISLLRMWQKWKREKMANKYAIIKALIEPSWKCKFVGNNEHMYSKKNAQIVSGRWYVRRNRARAFSMNYAFVPFYFIVRYVYILLRKITVWNESYNFFSAKCTHQHCVLVQKRRVKSSIWRSSSQQ